MGNSETAKSDDQVYLLQDFKLFGTPWTYCTTKPMPASVADQIVSYYRLKPPEIVTRTYTSPTACSWWSTTFGKCLLSNKHVEHYVWVREEERKFANILEKFGKKDKETD